jgi:hypothetical protein
MKYAREILDDIWKQCRQHRIDNYKPKLEVMIHEADMKTILVEELGYDISFVFGPRFTWEGVYPKKIFGEDIIITEEAVIGEPIVTIKSPHVSRSIE